MENNDNNVYRISIKDNNKKSDNDIKKYYKDVDKQTIDNCLMDDRLKNILKLSMLTNISVFDKTKTKWKIKDENKILKECKSKKKKKLKDFSSLIKDLSKEDNNGDIKKLKIINKKFENDINNIENMIDQVNVEKKNGKKKKEKNKDIFIEIYSN
jgi:hypothetical protein